MQRFNFLTKNAEFLNFFIANLVYPDYICFPPLSQVIKLSTFSLISRHLSPLQKIRRVVKNLQ